MIEEHAETPRRRRRDREATAVGSSLRSASLKEMARSHELRVGQPTHDDIARRAYALYEQRGRADGLDWQDWFQAERELQLLANPLEHAAV